MVHFDSEKLPAGQANRCDNRKRHTAGQLRCTRNPWLFASSIPRPIVECLDGTVGEIWVHGDNVAAGYWRKPEETQHTFGGKASSTRRQGTPEGPWLRTGDSGFFSNGRTVHQSAASRTS